MAGITTFIWLKRRNLLVFFFFLNRFLTEEDGELAHFLVKTQKFGSILFEVLDYNLGVFTVWCGVVLGHF